MSATHVTEAIARRNKHAAIKQLGTMALPVGYPAVPEVERRAVQADLALLEAFDATAIKDREALTVAAIKAFQARHGGKPTGALNTEERAALALAAGRRERAIGWHIVEDAVTGARLGLPTALVPQYGLTRTGSRWNSAHGQIQIRTFRLYEASLAALFEAEKKPVSHRIINYSELESDAFIIAGMEGLKEFTTRVEAHGTELRGITVLYDQATEGTMAPIALAVIDTFRGFPDPQADASQVERDVIYATGIVVADNGYVIAPAPAIDDCRAIAVAGLGHAERIAVDATSGIGLLRSYAGRNLLPVGFGERTDATGPLTSLGAGDAPGQATRPTLNHSSDNVGTASGPGAAAIDDRGRFAGMITTVGIGQSESTAAPRASLVPADTIGDFLTKHGVTPARGAVVTEQSIVRVICVR